MSALQKVRAGRYATDVIHRDCGGRIDIESKGSGNWKWESYCTKCLACDPNGWSTLKEAASEAVSYFAPQECQEHVS